MGVALNKTDSCIIQYTIKFQDENDICKTWLSLHVCIQARL